MALGVRRPVWPGGGHGAATWRSGYAADCKSLPLARDINHIDILRYQDIPGTGCEPDNKDSPPGQREAVARAGTKRDGDIKSSDPEHNSCDHLNQPLLLLHLSGSTIASFTAGGARHAVDVSRGGVVCTAARRMLALGIDPAEEIDVQRDGKRVLEPCRSVEWWAARTVVEDGEQGPRIRLLSPTEQPHSANSASYAPDCPKDKMRVYGPSVREVV
jgi:hypothetical protein